MVVVSSALQLVLELRAVQQQPARGGRPSMSTTVSSWRWGIVAGVCKSNKLVSRRGCSNISCYNSCLEIVGACREGREAVLCDAADG
jgi:hypothetical protein